MTPPAAGFPESRPVLPRLAACALVPLLTAAGPAPETGFGRQAPALPAGHWRVESIRVWEGPGKVRSDNTPFTAVFRPGEMELDLPGTPKGQWKYGIKVLRRDGDAPGQLDLTSSVGGAANKCLYRYDGERFQLALIMGTDRPRPTRFADVPGLRVLTYAPRSGRLIDPSPRLLPPKPMPKPATK